MFFRKAAKIHMYEMKVEKLTEDLKNKESSYEENQNEIKSLKKRLEVLQNDIANTEIINNDLVNCSFYFLIFYEYSIKTFKA